MHTKTNDLTGIDIETESGKQLMQALFTAGVTAAKQGDLSIFVALGNAICLSGGCQHLMVLFNVVFGGATMEEAHTWISAVGKLGEEKFGFLSSAGREQVKLLLKTNEHKIQALTGKTIEEIVTDEGGELEDSAPDKDTLWN